MKLISKFHDYYDCIQKMGYDDYPMFLRHQKEIEYVHPKDHSTENSYEQSLIEKLVNIQQGMPREMRNLSASRHVLVFCGRAYPCYEFQGNFYYDLDTLIKGIENHILDNDYRNPNLYVSSAEYHDWEKALAKLKSEKPPKKKRHHFNWTKALNKYSWEKFINAFKPDIPIEIHQHFKTPILALSPYVFKAGLQLIVNPCLKEFDFQKIKDPYTVWQEISMYLGNELVSQMDPNPPISDKVRAESKGFDDWSFRRHSDEGRKAKKK